MGIPILSNHLWYHRLLSIPAEWAGKRIWLHFGAVDFECEAFIDGKLVGRHWGGTSSFAFDLTAHVTLGGNHQLVLAVHDDVRSKRQPGGKQSQRFNSHNCYYTRTTGIWQTVWLEAIDPFGLESVQVVPDLDTARFVVTPRFYAVRRGLTLRVTAMANGEQVSQVERPALNGLPLDLELSSVRAWSPQDPFLYDLRLEVTGWRPGPGFGQFLCRAA